jgi:GTPase SAR1 family protein
MTTLRLKELDLDLIAPNTENMNDFDQGGSKIVIIGKPKSGKSYLIRDLLYSKKHIFPVGMVINGTEDSNHFYSNMFPETFIYDQMNTSAIQNFKRRQRLAKQILPNPWSVLIVDDAMDQTGIFKTPLFQDIFKNGRHWKMMLIMAMQYSMDIPPGLRICIDGTFIFREPNLKYRKSIYENYASVIPDFKTFCDIMDQITNDYTALYIHNQTASNNIEDCIFWYKAKQVPDSFTFGCQDYWEFHRVRFDESYTKPI